MNNMNDVTQKRYNEEFIQLLENLNSIMLNRGEPFRAKAYQKAQQTIMEFPQDIYNPNQLNGCANIGPTIMDKLNEYFITGTLKIIEQEKTNPINILSKVHGIGPKKAEELVSQGIHSIEELRKKQHLLNTTQRIGLKYFEQIQERIPRTEINNFNSIFKSIFKRLSKEDEHLEIVGSYRRGAPTSGDIDVIITCNDNTTYQNFIDELINKNIILEILSRGHSKTLVIVKMSNFAIARRIDFLYTSPEEFPFAILYFTGSKIFNTVMRQHALNKGYTFNEHGMYHLNLITNGKGQKVNYIFKTEKDIFDFLDLEFKEPHQRQDGRSIIEIKKPEEPSKKTEEPLKEFIHNFKTNGISILNKLNEEELTNIILIANKHYFNRMPIMTDNEYDIIKEFIENKYPKNKAIHEIGAEVERNKTLLPYEMPSMDKIKPDTGSLNKWLNKYKGSYILSCKLDGVSGLYDYTHSKPKLYTRGDGRYGQDISHLIPYLPLPKTTGIVIRGEFIIPKDIFEQKYKNIFANPRNMVAGMINHKQISSAIVDLHFVAYEVIVPELTPSDQLKYLSTIKMEHVLNTLTYDLSNEYLSDMLIDWRKNYMYEIDGIIVTNNKIYPRKTGNPEHSFAFKMVLSEQMAEAKVVDVIWTPSKDGYLKPRVQIEPIQLCGVIIEYATGFNASFIEENYIGVGAVIEIIRSGDVIPYINSVTIPAESPKMPNVPYKWNETCVDIMLINASEDPIVKEKNITGFFRGIEVEGLSSGNITRMINAGFDTVSKIIQMEEKDFLTIEGFKEKMANKLYNGIQQKLKEASIVKLMASSNIFGRGFSDKKIELILNALPNILISNDTKDKKINDIASIKGMALKTAEAFVEKIDDFIAFLKECQLEYKLVFKPNEINNTHPLFGKTVVLTGTRDKNIIEFLKQIGANQGSNVSKNTSLVIAKNKEEDTGKAEEARKLNIPLMTVEEFKTMFIK
jgi:NAD-dependent DNA ligase